MSFDGYKIVAIAAGDEFSLVVDDKSTPWVWGRADHGEVRRNISKHMHKLFVES